MTIGGIKLAIWDLGGQKILREYWSNYFENTGVLIYVIDAADEARLDESGNELNAVLADPIMKDVPVLIFANKQDLMHALEPDAVR